MRGHERPDAAGVPAIVNTSAPGHFCHLDILAPIGTRSLSVDRFFRSPRDSTQQQNTKQRIIESPAVVATNADEDSALSFFCCPHLRRCHPVFNTTGEKRDVGQISGELPIAFVVQLQLLKVANNRVVRVVDIQCQRA